MSIEIGPPICILDNPCVRGTCSGDDFGTDDFQCDCTGTGYQGINCTTDYDECANDDHSCDPVSERCSNTIGSYDCVCAPGFEDNSGTCDDINECTDGTDDCLSSQVTCVNIPGNYTCDCDAGYEGDGRNSGTGCSNIDECSEGTDTCHYRASCTDSVGSYVCVCNAGYTGDGESCSDMDECNLGIDNCLSGLSQCQNGIGTFSCACVNGYDGDGVNNCTDIDECGGGTDSCHSQAMCNNTVGSYVCTCNDGFSGSGWVCSDNDECTLGTHNCLNNTGNCTNTYGSFDCACNSGYHGDGVTYCNDTNECVEEIDNCHPTFANCNNTIGDFICTCFAGYSGNGVRCEEINECIDYNVTCSFVGTCIDLIDDYICDCEYGYWDKNCDKDAAYLYTSNYFSGSLYWSFDTFNETGDSSYPNQNVNMSMYNAIPGLAVLQNYSISGNSIRTRFNGTDDCIDFGDFTGSCYSDPSLCTEGFAMSIWIRLTEDEIKESGPVYIMSSGLPDARGFGIYRETRKITVKVNDGSTTFSVELNNLMPADLWKNLGFAWSSTHGLSVFLDRARVGNDPSGSSTGLSDVLNTMTLGCRYNGGAFTAHSTGMFDELFLLPRWINTTNELIWLMGGWDEDNCVIEPCVYGDCYDAGMAAYICDCYPGYNETHCDTEIDECESFPCQNGGTCTDWVAYYTCECAFGYTGYSCEKDLSPNYDYSNVKSLKAQFLLITPEINPYYATVADHYFPLNNLGELDITGLNVSAAFGRAELGLYPSIDGADTYVEIANFTDGCLSDPSLCPLGFTLAFWFHMNEKPTDMQEGMIFSTAGPVNGERVGINIALSGKKEVVIEVCDGSTLSKVTIPRTALAFKNWLHLGVSWSDGQGLIVYLGGKTYSTEPTVTSANAVNTYDTMTLGSLFGSKGSAVSVVFNDLVIWGCAVKPYERHILFGMTHREFAMIETSDHYWTSDGYVRRDWTTLADYMPEYAANIHPMDRAGEADVILGHGRDEKGQSVMVLGDGDGWLFFGDFAGQCLSNAHKCSDGISVSTWVRLSQVFDNETHFLISSGEQVTRGFSIYQRDVDRLGAAVSDGSTRWVTEIVHIPFIQYEDNMTVTDAPMFDFMGEWTNLGLTWTKDQGLFFYMNGRVVAHDPIGYQKFRNSDFETLLILGRRNDFLGHASNISFDELVIAERKMEPYEYRDAFAKMDNLQYMDASYKWTPLDLISGNPHVLSTHNLPQGFVFNGTAYPRQGYIGPTSNITLEDDWTVNLPGYPDYITLGDFRETFISKPTGKGLSVSFWAKLHFEAEPSQNDAHNVVVNPPSANDTTTLPPPTTPSPPAEKQYLMSSGGQGSHKGFNIFLEGKGLNFVIDDGETMSWKRINTDTISSDAWTNIAFTWHRSEKFIIYINGKEITPTDTIVSVSSCCPGNQTLFTIGRGMKENSEYATFKLHNLVIWEKYIHPQHVHRLLGVTSTEKYYMDLSDFYWPFDPPADFPFPVLGFEGGTRLMDDRHHFGRSAYLDGKNDYVRLRDFGKSHCVTNPARCVNGMAMGMWVKLRDIPSSEKCLLTSGADVAGERGVAFIQTPDYLKVMVSDGRQSWLVEKFLDKDLFGVWLYLAFRWHSESGLKLFINGRNEGEKESGTEDERSSLVQTELLLGRCSYSASSNGYLEAHYDDVVIIIPSADQSQPGASELHGDPICTGYVTPDLYFNLTSPDSGVTLYDTKAVKRFTKYGGDKRGVSLFHRSTSRGLVDVGNFRQGCLSSPSSCLRGVTISFWMRLLNIDNLDDPVLNPQRKAYILSSGAQDINSTGFVILTNNETTTVEVRTEHRHWKKHFLLGFIDEWTNLALTWSRQDGLSFFVNGEYQYEYDLPTTISTYNSTYNATTTNAPTTTPIPTTTEATTTVVTTQPMTTVGNITNGTTPGNVTFQYTTDQTTTPFIERETTLEVTTTPIWTTPYRWSTRENDTYSHLVLGARNDLNEGYTRAEFADLAVWYDAIDMLNPELAKMVMGQECHEIVVTDNHEELAGYEVWTGTIECDDRHLADCTDNLDSFFEVVSKASFEDPTVYEIAKVRLKNYTHTGTYMTVDQIKMTTVLLEKALTRTLPETMMPEEAQSDMEDLLTVTSNLFSEERQRRWTTIHQARRRRSSFTTDSALGIAVKLEDYLMGMAKIVEGENGTWTGVNMTISTDNIVIQVDRYRADDVIPGTIYQFPDYTKSEFQYDPGPNSSSIPLAADQITLPSNVYDYIPAKRDNNGIITMVGIMFHTLDEILPIISSEDEIYKDSMKVNSRIIFLRINPPLRKSLYNKIVMQFEHKKPLTDSDEPYCVFWDFSVRYTKEGAWSMRGCTLEESNDTHTTCHCDHLTHFAILTQDKDPVVVSIHAKYLQYITWGGIVLSLIALILLLLIFISVGDIHNIRNSIHINMILSMVFAKITYIVLDFLDPSAIDWITCKAIACVMQFFYTGVFSWMLIQGVHLLVETCNPKNIPYKEKFRYYFLIAWGIPFMIVGTSFALAHQGYGTTEECWLTFQNNALWIFLGTSLSIIFINMIIVVFVYCTTSKQSRRSDPLKARKASLRATAIVLPLLGITWSLSVVEVKYGLIELTYVFTALHALQGLFIAIFYGVCNPEVRLAFMGADFQVELSKVEETRTVTPEPEELELVQLAKPSYKA
ncbi:uncharacterized protein LOC135153166 isoform X1 [Lytechinus pictus]|uniref:uncharacterized protein LOC135153166 isoform X1 n=1 Tax=Lytechinus pictus TaxID=7653 RepID=UPI0030B9C5BF